MIKAVLLDCGGVIVAPTTGDWILTPGHEEILGDDFAQTRLDEFRKARAAFVHLIPDANLVMTDEEECAMFVPYLDQSLRAMGITLTKAQLERLAWIQTYRDDRYTLFDDVLPWLDKWKGQYKLGIVSDAPPSTRRIMTTLGVTERLDGATYSSEIGALKPDPAIYLSTLRKLDVQPEEAVFVDDMTSRLEGARALGMRCIQMRRPMPPLFKMSPFWDGMIVHDFTELDALLSTL